MFAIRLTNHHILLATELLNRDDILTFFEFNESDLPNPPADDRLYELEIDWVSKTFAHVLMQSELEPNVFEFVRGMMEELRNG